MNSSPVNLHATALVVGDRGILLMGDSGAGKTALALALLDASRSAGAFARLVSDDQVLLSVRAGHLIARPPRPIAGLIEVYGSGPYRSAIEVAAVIDLAFSLVAPGQVPRMQDEAAFRHDGVSIPMLLLPARSTVQSVPIVVARLGLKPLEDGAPRP